MYQVVVAFRKSAAMAPEALTIEYYLWTIYGGVALMVSHGELWIERE